MEDRRILLFRLMVNACDMQTSLNARGNVRFIRLSTLMPSRWRQPLFMTVFVDTFNVLPLQNG